MWTLFIFNMLLGHPTKTFIMGFQDKPACERFASEMRKEAPELKVFKCTKSPELNMFKQIRDLEPKPIEELE
jgi:hypothetical protein